MQSLVRRVDLAQEVAQHFAGPTSINSSTPAPTSACTQSTHRTAPVTWRTRVSRHRGGGGHQLAGDVGGTGIRGSDNWIAARMRATLLSRLHQGAVERRADGSITARRAPLALASAEAFSTAASAPEMTVWPGEFRLAAATVKPVSWAASRQASATAPGPATGWRPFRPGRQEPPAAWPGREP